MADSARKRLQPLVDWINDVIEKARHVADEWTEEHGYAMPEMPKSEVRRRLRVFVRDYDDSVLRVGRVNTKPETWPTKLQVRGQDGKLLPETARLADVEGMRLEELRFYLHSLLMGDPALPLPSLMFQIDRDGGLNTAVVSGTLPDVVLYVAIHLVTTEYLDIGVCIAPAPSFRGVPNDWRTQPKCGKLFIRGGPGRPKGDTCDDNCRKRILRMQESLAKARRR